MSGASFYVVDAEDETEAALVQAYQAEKAVITTWELGEAQYQYAEVQYKTSADAAQAYEVYCNQRRLFSKQANTVVWVSGLPAVVCVRDVYTSLQELTPGLLSITVPRNPEYGLDRFPGPTSLGVAVLVYDSRYAAEEAIRLLQTPTRLYALSYKAMVGRDLKVLEAAPLVDICECLQKETRLVVISRLPLQVSIKQLEQELSCFGQLVRLRRYATWAVVTMRTVAEAKALVACRQLLVDGRVWELKAGCRLDEDPIQPDLYSHMKRQTPRTSSSSAFNSNQPAYELSVLQLSIADRQRLYEVLQSGNAFPCKKDALVKGLSLDLLNKARKLLQNSRKVVEEPPPSKKPRFTGGQDYNYTVYQPGIQTMSDEEKLQYFYALNSKPGMPPYYR